MEMQEVRRIEIKIATSVVFTMFYSHSI